MRIGSHLEAVAFSCQEQNGTDSFCVLPPAYFICSSAGSRGLETGCNLGDCDLIFWDATVIQYPFDQAVLIWIPEVLKMDLDIHLKWNSAKTHIKRKLTNNGWLIIRNVAILASISDVQTDDPRWLHLQDFVHS